MITDTLNCDVQGKNTAQDLVHLKLVVARKSVENGTVERLRKAGKLDEEELRVIGLVDHLVEKYGYLYGAGLIYALHYSMDYAGNDEEAPLKAIDEAVQSLIDAFSRPYDEEVAA